MTVVKGAAAKSFLERRDPNVKAVLIYGPDGGLVRERSDQLARQVVADLKDPFNFIELTEAELKSDPPRLADEAAALSMMGGDRVIRVRTGGESAARIILDVLKTIDSDTLKTSALILVEAGELAPRSGLRKGFEKSNAGAALPCYADSTADIRTLIETTLLGEEVSIDRDALEFLADNLGEDRGVTRSELEKIALYGKGGGNSLTLEEVTDLIASEGDADFDSAAFAVADGDLKTVEMYLSRAQTAGANSVTLLRALARHFDRLCDAKGAMETGQNSAQAMKSLRPPVFFARTRQFEGQLQRWSSARLSEALRLIFSAERDVKRTGSPQNAISSRTALRLCRLARSRG